jgi:FkbM family methyltransferase
VTLTFTPAYTWILRNRIQERRGGARLLNALVALSPWAIVDGVVLDMRALNWQVAQLVSRIAKASEHEPAVKAVIRERVRADHVALDIGANLGLHTVSLSRAAKTVHAFEPNPLLLPALRRTLARHPNVVLHECALGEQNGSISIVAGEDHSMGQVAAGNDLPIRRLDDVLSGPVHFIKIDVEGYEVNVFRGAERLLRDQHPTVVFEEVPQWGNTEARHHLESLGYRCERLDERDWLAW